MANNLSKVTVNYNYLNPYDNIYATYEHTPFFDKTVWDDARLKGGNALDSYVYMLQNQKNMPSLQSLNELYGYDYASPDDKLFMLSIVANKNALSSEDTRTMRYEKIYNFDGKEIGKKEIGEMTDFEYNEMMLKKQKSYLEQQKQFEWEQEVKDSMSGWNKFWNGVGSTAYHFIDGFVSVPFDMVQFLWNVSGTLAEGLSAIWDGEVSDSELRRIWSDDSISNNDFFKGIRESVQEWERTSTNFRNIYGETTGVGDFFIGTSESIGTMLGAAAIGWATGGSSGITVVQKISSAIQTVSFYSGSFNKRMQSAISRDVENNSSVLQMLAVNTVRTAADAIIERASGELFGFTAADRMKFGTKIAAKSTNPWARFFLEGLQEGLEEVVQDSVDWVISSFADVYNGNTNAIYADNLSIGDLALSFGAGAVSALVMGGFNKVINKVRSDNRFRKIMTDTTIDDLVATRRNEYKQKYDVLEQRYNSAKSQYDNNLQLYKDNPEMLEQSKIEFDNISQDYEIAKTALDTANEELNARVSQRKITWESLDRKDKKEFKHGLYGLINTMSELSEMTWKMENIKSLQKDAKYFKQLLSDAYKGIAKFYGQIGQERMDNFNRLMVQLETLSSDKKNAELFLNESTVINEQLKGPSKLTTDNGLNIIQITANAAYSSIMDLISNFEMSKEIRENVSKAIEETTKTDEKKNKTNKNVTKTLTKNQSIRVNAIFDGKDNFKDADGNIIPIDQEGGISKTASDNLKGISNEYKVDIAITLNNKQVRGTNKAILVPVQMTENPSNDIVMNLGMNEALGTMSANMDEDTKKWIVDLWSERNNGKLDNQYTFEEVIAQILCSNDTSTFQYMLSKSDITTVRWIAKIVSYFNLSRKEIQGIKDKAVVSVLKQTLDKLKPIVMSYVLELDAVDQQLWNLCKEIFDSKELTKIENDRFTKHNAELIVEGKNKNSDEYKRAKDIITRRIDNMVILSTDERQSLKDAVFGEYVNDRLVDGEIVEGRMSAMQKINDYYDGIFYGKYDNKTYLRDKTSGNIMFNTWLKQNNMTISSLFAEGTDIKSLMDQFRVFSAGAYSFKVTLKQESKIQVFETKNMPKQNYGIYNQFFKVAKYHTLSTAQYNKIFTKLFKEDASLMLEVSSLTDIFANPEQYFTNEVLEAIKEDYKYVNPETIREFLVDYLINKYDYKYNIVPNQNGDYNLYEYHTIDYFLNKDAQENFFDNFVKGKAGTSYEISKFVKRRFLVGDLKNTKIIIVNNKKDAEYDFNENIIYLSTSSYDKVNDKNKRASMSLIHEICHAIDYQNGFNMGANAYIDLPDIVVNDINKHLVQVGDTKLTKEQVLRNYFYPNTGELNTFGQEYFFNRYPIVSTYDPTTRNLTYTFPWGSKMVVRDGKVISYNDETFKRDDDVKSSNTFQELQGFVIDGQLNSARLNPFDITESDYNEAKDYISKIKEARKDSDKKDFGKTDKNYGLPSDILKSMLTGDYDGRKDATYRAASKIIQIYERNVERQSRSIKRKKSSETYTYGQLTASKAKGTLAEYYMNKGKYANIRGLFTASMKKFLYETSLDDLSNFDEDFVKFIRKSQPTQSGIFDYFRNNYSTMNKYTFDAIKNAFFPDSFVSGPKELSAIIDSAAELYSLSRTMIDSENADLINFVEKKSLSKEVVNKATYNKVIERLKQIGTEVDENFSTEFDKNVSNYSTGIDEGQLALNLMKVKIKTISSIGNVLAIAGMQAEGIHGWKSRSEYQKFLKSIDDTVEGQKGDDKAMDLSEVIAAEQNELDEYGFNDLQQEAIRAYQEEVLPYDKELKELNDKLSERIERSDNKPFETKKAQSELNKAIKLKIEAFQDKVFSMDENSLIDYLSKLYTTTRIADEDTISEYEELLRQNAKSNVNASQAYQVLSQYIKRTKQLSYLNKNTISYVPENARKYLVPTEQGYYSFNLGKVRKDNLSGEQINKLRMDLRNGLSIAKTMSAASYQLEKNIEKYNKETVKTTKQKELIEKLRKQRNEAVEELTDVKQTVKELNKELKRSKATVNDKGEVRYETTIKNVKLTVTSDIPMPQRLYDALNIHFKDEAVTKIKYAQDPTMKHTVITIDEFIKNSAEIFAGITTDEAVDILNYFIDSGLSVSIDLNEDSDLNKLVGIRNLVLSTMLAYDKDGIIALSDDIKQKSYKLLESSVSEAGRTLSQWQGIINKLHPSRTLFQEFKKLWGIEIDDADVETMVNFAKLGKFDEVNKQLDKYAEKLRQKMKDEREENKGRWVANQITNFMKAMMLSSPRTWVRNQTSNAILTLTDHITKPFGNAAVSIFKSVRNSLNKLFPKIGMATEGYREGQINLSQDYNTDKQNKLKELKSQGKFNEAAKLQEEIASDKEDADNLAKAFIKSPIFALIGDNLSRYNYQEHLSEQEKKALEKHSDANALIKLMAENTRTKIAQEMSWDPKIVKPLSKLTAKVGMNTPDGLIAFIWKMNSDGFWIQKRAQTYIRNLILQYDLTSELSQYVSNKGTSSSDLMGLALTNQKFASAISDALGYASYEYMHRVNFWSNARSYLRREYPNLAVGMDLFMPFMSGAWNWFLDSMKRNPVGLAVSLVRYANLDKVIKKNERKLDRYQRNVSRDRPSYDPKFTEYTIRNDIGKGIWGTICYVIGGTLAAAGFIDKDEDDKYRLNFGSFSLDISYVFGTEPFMMGASTVIGTRDRNAFLDILDSAVATTMEDFFLTNWVNTIKYNDSFIDLASDKLVSLVTSFYPNSLKALNRVINNGKIKYDKGFIGDVQYATYTMIPYFPMKWWPKKVDPYTGDVEVAYSSSWLVNLINESGILAGIKIKTSMPGNLEGKLDYLGHTIGQLTGNYDDIGKLPTQILNTYYGKFNDKYITDFLNNRTSYTVIDEKTNKKVTLKYSQMTIKQKDNVINRIKSQNAKYAKIATWTQQGHKYYATRDERTELARVGITTNVLLETNKLKGFVK